MKLSYANFASSFASMLGFEHDLRNHGVTSTLELALEEYFATTTIRIETLLQPLCRLARTNDVDHLIVY
jgi:hypothetical protein